MRKLVLLTAAALVLGAGAAHANSAIDRPHDFLKDAVHDADLDFTGISVTFDEATQNFLISATLDGAFTSNPGNYVLGVNTGTGTSHPFGGVLEGNVRFNQAFILQKTGGISNAAITATLTDRGFSLLVPLSLLPATLPGFQPGSYGFNLWSRGPANQLVDFAPDNRLLSAVPEPASWALMIAGFGLTGAAMRRSRKSERRSVLA